MLTPSRAQTFTALELADRSHQAENRKRVFDDLSTKPTAWTSLYQGCIAQLGKSYHRLYTRGGRLTSASGGGSSTSATASKEPLTGIPTAQMRQVQSVFYVPPSATKPAALVDQVKATDAKIVELAAAGISYIRQRAPTKDTLGHAGEKALEWISPLEAHVPEQVKPVVKSITEGAETARHRVESVGQSLQGATDAVSSTVHSVAAEVAKPANKEWRQHGLYPAVARLTEKIAPRGGSVRSWVDRVVSCVDWWLRPCFDWSIYRADSAFARRWAADEIEFVLPRRRIDADLLRSRF